MVKLPSAVDDWMFGALSALETDFEFHAPKPPSQVGIFPVAKNAWVVCARSAPESLFAFDEHAAAHTHSLSFSLSIFLSLSLSPGRLSDCFMLNLDDIEEGWHP